MAKTTTREIALNNPCGLKRFPPIKWRGLADDQPDPTLCKFVSPELGIRAPVRNLMTYGSRGINTVRSIITSWAPPDPAGDKNPTDQYIANVCAWCGWDADDELELDSADTMRPLIKAIIRQENGVQPYSDAVIDSAMRLAGISDVPKPSAAKSPVIQGATVATVGTGVAAISQVASQLRDVQDSVDAGVGFVKALVSWGPWVAIALVALGIAGLAYGYFKKRHSLGV